MRKDHFGNLWLGTDHGIDFVEINSPLSILSYNYGLSAGYTSIIYNDNIYLGTNQGLFSQNWVQFLDGGIGPKEMSLIEETRGQVWALEEIDGVLFCGHTDGTFIIEGEKVEKISSISGGWSFQQLPEDGLKIIGGTYSGLILFVKEKGKWQFSHIVKGFTESSRNLFFDKDGSLWIAHGLKGVYHLWLNSACDSVLKIDLKWMIAFEII